MCGIVGAVSARQVEKMLLAGLKRLEYRGYDSAGLAVISKENQIKRIRVKGKVNQLEDIFNQSNLTGFTGITHTRWATHGVPSENNAHPFMSSDDFALVHNGIIENYHPLRQRLMKSGYQFSSQTDSEVVVHLFHSHFQTSKDLVKAAQLTGAELQGAFALAILSRLHPNQLVAMRRGSPLVVGKGSGENFLASDSLALLSMADEFLYLEDDDIAILTPENIAIYNHQGKPVERQLQKATHQADVIDKGNHRHFMSKEIFEQPKAILRTLENRIVNAALLPSLFGFESSDLFKKVSHVQFVACGTSYHAALVARYWLEALAGVSCSVDVASEFRYRESFVPKNTLFVTLSQSGETADTLAALRLAKTQSYLASLAICNVPASSLVRESDYSFMTAAGVEIGVASTKSFLTQLISLLLLSLAVGKEHQLSSSKEKEILTSLLNLNEITESILKLNDEIATLANLFIDKQHALFLGRGGLYPIALEGALKLKEISYIHAEGYPAGELKHGPLALVDKKMPVIALAPANLLFDKMNSNLAEVSTRGGELIIFSDANKSLLHTSSENHFITMPSIHPILAPMAYVIPLQLLSYHVAVLKGTDVDQPRNLAKSVTVE